MEYPLICTPYLVKFMSKSRQPPIIMKKMENLQETMLRLNNLFQRDILWERAEVGTHGVDSSEQKLCLQKVFP